MRLRSATCAFLLLNGCSKGGSVLAFADDADASCAANDLRDVGEVREGLWSVLDGISECAASNPARGNEHDSIVHYSGWGWTPTRAQCQNRRILSDYLRHPNASEAVIRQGFQIPSDAFGYCVFDEGGPGEYVVYNVCDRGDADLQCFLARPRNNLTASWYDCPEGALCPSAPADECISRGLESKSYSMSMYVDNPAWACPEESGLESSQDSLLITLSIGWTASSVLCLGASGYDATGAPQFGVSAAVVSPLDPKGGLPKPSEGTPSPKGASGYCSFYEDTVYAFVLFNMCDATSSAGTDGSKPLTPEEACEQGANSDTEGFRRGFWNACPGSPLCVD